jgi:pimeloyl-ACP methyl ester carboxylesterase
MGTPVLLAVAAVLTVACSASPGVVTVDVGAISDANPPSAPGPGADPGADPSADPSADPGADPAGDIAWTPCEGSLLIPVDFECGDLTVPLDYTAPEGPTIEIAVVRVPTRDDDERIGSLLFNPGGPGGSGIEFLRAAALIMPDELQRRFDLVSFDPRGVGDSTAIDCDADADDRVELLAPGDDQGWAALVADAEAWPTTCTAETLEIAALVGTNNAARDLDRLRGALGDEDLTYVGFSYGTRLGATYAELFPDRVRALVLDGAVKPSNDLSAVNAEQGPGFDRALERFAAACDDDPDCPLTGVGPALEVYDSLRTTMAADGPLPTADPERVLTPGEAVLGVAAALYSTQLWPVLAQALADATVEGDGTLLHGLVDTYLGRRPDGTYDNSQNAGFAINCADDVVRPPVDVVRARAEDVASRSRYFADFLRASTGCIGAPIPADPLIIGPAVGAPPILVIGTTGDPATPYEWSVEMADFLDSGVLFTVEGDGHTAFLSEPCVEDVVVDYLVDLTLPDTGASCSTDAEFDPFPAAGESDIDKVVALFACLRENGADVPEVTVADVLADPTGESLFSGIDPTDPGFAVAALACRDLLAGF